MQFSAIHNLPHQLLPQSALPQHPPSLPAHPPSPFAADHPFTTLSTIPYTRLAISSTVAYIRLTMIPYNANTFQPRGSISQGNTPQPNTHEQNLRQDIASLNARLDSDDIHAGNSNAVAPLLKDMDASSAVGHFASMITFAQTSPQKILRWRNCQAHKTRLSKLDLSNPTASLNHMRQALVVGRKFEISNPGAPILPTPSITVTPPGCPVPQQYTISAPKQPVHIPQRPSMPFNTPQTQPAFQPQPTFQPRPIFQPVVAPSPPIHYHTPPKPASQTAIHYIPTTPSTPLEKETRIAHNCALFPRLLANGDNVLAYAYREYLEVYPTRRGERVNRYYVNLLANQVVEEGGDEGERLVVLFAKERWWNFWEAGERDREVVRGLVVEKGWRGEGW
ncbi:hypothetical protein DM02DRAFT_614636 [Periconia macrospinosa]|uniref:Uncharacterized protein n=1 Tax=Periconia macrospinosa TaxID=97972 RepID=A0A2V1DPX6_9PLEO|nr:hypothetical protein DM02DRAFT_614636 [Periconia macrospinosa]